MCIRDSGSLDLTILKDRLDHQFAAFKIGIIGGRENQSQQGIGFLLRGIPALDGLGQQAEGLLTKAIQRGYSTQEKADALLGLILPTTDYADLEGCELVIEAVFENREIKAAAVSYTHLRAHETVLDLVCR